ncbi:hypothetical protein AAFC00_001433 [Neodothiora populina]|uniref:Gfo/Idh/MocA-like oxidoreductase N-terminal domain-containing protein n=1 Tax=Neodothiora populina TaxID=2781224 RepID=A0ABR3PPZ5_9PEZI
MGTGNAGQTVQSSTTVPRILIIGAGSRGNAYARAVHQSGQGIVAAVAEPIDYKRQLLGSKYIWPGSEPQPEHEFSDWRDFVKWETQRREHASAGLEVPEAIHGVFICVLDEQHVEVVTGLAPFKLHILCEKPLATTLRDCLDIYRSMLPTSSQDMQKAVFGIGHVLRYSPHNMLLRKLVLEDRVIGDVMSIEHTEPVGNWHFSHSYVRGNWRKESTTAPSLLCKSCHDIDFLLWMLCSPPKDSTAPAHIPSSLSSTGSLKQFRRLRKPAAAGDATNCLKCNTRDTCVYSAPRIYYDKQLAKGNTDWPVNIVEPEIESCYITQGAEAAKEMLFNSLGADYDAQKTPRRHIEARPWYGRCVWESDNDVCDDQFVTITWDDEPATCPSTGQETSPLHFAKTASFHMIAQTEKQCERRGWIYGSEGEISYDGTTITVYDFATQGFTRHDPPRRGGGHGGGDDGLATQFLKAIDAVLNHGVGVEEAQAEHLGCSLEEVVRSHALVFAAEEARRDRKVVDWKDWWAQSMKTVTADA